METAILDQFDIESNNKIKVKKQNNPKKWLSLIVLALAVAIVVIDGTVLNVAQKYVIDDLNTDIKTLQWAFTGYSLVLAALTIFGGRLGDLYGRKKMFVVGALIFALGSLITATANDASTLIFGWSFIEGIGAALMMPASSALLISNFEGKERGIAFGIYGAMAGAASSFGPIVGGYFASSIGWRYAFAINVVVAALLCIGAIIVKDRKDLYPKNVNLDPRSVILSSLGMVLIVYGIIESSTYGWISAKKPFEVFGQTFNSPVSITLWAIIAGIFVLELFLYFEKKTVEEGKDPLFHLDIFKNKDFSFGIGTLATLFAGFSGFITYGVVFFFLVVNDLSAFEAGLALIPFSLASFILAPLSSKIAEKIGNKNLIIMGLSVSLLGNYITYKTIEYGAVPSDFILAFIVTGVGFGMLAAQLNNIILSSVDQQDAGVASGINGTFREIARAFGVAIIGAAFISSLTNNAIKNISNLSNDTVPEEIKTNLISDLNKNGLSIDLAKNKTEQEVLQEAKTKGIPVDIPEVKNEYLDKYHNIQNSIETSFKKSVASASQNAILYTISFNIFAIVCAFGIGDKRKS